MGQPKKICLITPGHIASNPRLVKEATALAGNGYAVHIVFTQYLPYLRREDSDILIEHPGWTFSVLDWTGGNLKSKALRLFYGIVQKICIALYSIAPLPYLNFYIHNRFFSWQLKQAAANKAHLYIAHNLGALPVAFMAAKRNSSKAGFDAEDFHRNETTNNTNSKSYKTCVTVEDLFLPQIDHFTAASPLIKLAYQKLYPNLQNAVAILNVFPKIECQSGAVDLPGQQPLKLFWFSQTVGKGRGIEEIIEAIGLYQEAAIELHLLGNCPEETKAFFLKLAEGFASRSGFLHFHPPVSEKNLFQIASQCDIGLASETGIPHNRDICLTNKIFTYIQAGLAVLASDTQAQISLFQSYPGIGYLYMNKNRDSLFEAIKKCSNYRDKLDQCKRHNYELGQNIFNWDIEQKNF